MLTFEGASFTYKVLGDPALLASQHCWDCCNLYGDVGGPALLLAGGVQ